MLKKLSILIIAFLFISCDIFTTREADPPDQSASNFTPAVEREMVISNLKNAFLDKNVVNYIKCFVDSNYSKKRYTFSASSEALALFQIFSEGWGLREERIYFSNMITKVPQDFPIALSLSNENFSSLGGDSLVYSATYFINLPIQSGGSLPQNYEGNLEFKMLRDSKSEWVIYFWKDTKSQTLPSWSEMKGSLY